LKLESLSVKNARKQRGNRMQMPLLPLTLGHLTSEEWSLAFQHLVEDLPSNRKLTNNLNCLSEGEWVLVALTLATILEESQHLSLH